MEPILGKHSVYPSLEESTSQRLAEASIQGVHPQVLDWHTGFPGRVELAATFGLAEAEPVGGVVAGAAETRSFDAGLEQHRAVCVDVLPVSGKLGEGAVLRLGCDRDVGHLCSRTFRNAAPAVASEPNCLASCAHGTRGGDRRGNNCPRPLDRGNDGNDVQDCPVSFGCRRDREGCDRSESLDKALAVKAPVITVALMP
jgi:hypothetical protein